MSEASNTQRSVNTSSNARNLLQVGERKEGVPSRKQLYETLKNRSIELQSASGKK